MEVAEVAQTGDDWYTPAWLLAWLGPIDLDPCYSAASAVQARYVIDVRQGGNGLTDPWPGDGLVFANPPFSNTSAWLGRCRREGKSRVVVVLVPAMAADGPWHEHVWGRAAWVGLLRGRVAFADPQGRSEVKGRGHALVIYGPRFKANEVKDRIAAAALRHPQRPYWVPGNWILTGE